MRPCCPFFPAVENREMGDRGKEGEVEIWFQGIDVVFVQEDGHSLRSNYIRPLTRDGFELCT